MEVRLPQRSLSISVLLHALFVATLFWWGARDGASSRQPPETIWIELEPTAKAPDDRNRQIVRSQEGELAKTAAPNAFLGKETRRVDRETVAQFQNAQVESMPQAKPKTQTGKTRAAQPEVAQEKTPSFARLRDLAKLGVSIAPPAKEKPVDRPDYVDFSGSFGGPTAQDYVKGMKESDRSALNTREFAFFSYFQRVRTQLDHAWQGILHEKLVRMYRDGRSIASESDHTTKTVVTLDVKGEVIRVQLLEESGVIDLDDAAVKAFNQAGPFPNPPKDMVDSSGLIRIRWDFILKT